jgi:hypothetical protein
VQKYLEASYCIPQISSDPTRKNSTGVKSGGWYLKHTLDSMKGDACVRSRDQDIRHKCAISYIAPARTVQIARDNLLKGKEGPADHTKWSKPHPKQNRLFT